MQTADKKAAQIRKTQIFPSKPRRFNDVGLWAHGFRKTILFIMFTMKEYTHNFSTNIFFLF